MLDLIACPLSPIDYGNSCNDYWNNELNCIIIQCCVGLGITGAVLFALSLKILHNNGQHSIFTRKMKMKSVKHE